MIGTDQAAPSGTASPPSTRRQRLLRIVGMTVLPPVFILAIIVIGAYTYSAAILNPVTITPITASPNRFDGRYLLTRLLPQANLQSFALPHHASNNVLH